MAKKELAPHGTVGQLGGISGPMIPCARSAGWRGGTISETRGTVWRRVVGR